MAHAAIHEAFGPVAVGGRGPDGDAPAQAVGGLALLGAGAGREIVGNRLRAGQILGAQAQQPPHQQRAGAVAGPGGVLGGQGRQPVRMRCAGRIVVDRQFEAQPFGAAGECRGEARPGRVGIGRAAHPVQQGHQRLGAGAGRGVSRQLCQRPRPLGPRRRRLERGGPARSRMQRQKPQAVGQGQRRGIQPGQPRQRRIRRARGQRRAQQQPAPRGPVQRPARRLQRAQRPDRIARGQRGAGRAQPAAPAGRAGAPAVLLSHRSAPPPRSPRNPARRAVPDRR